MEIIYLIVKKCESIKDATRINNQHSRRLPHQVTAQFKSCRFHGFVLVSSVDKKSAHNNGEKVFWNVALIFSGSRYERLLRAVVSDRNRNSYFRPKPNIRQQKKSNIRFRPNIRHFFLLSAESQRFTTYTPQNWSNSDKKFKISVIPDLSIIMYWQTINSDQKLVSDIWGIRKFVAVFLTFFRKKWKKALFDFRFRWPLPNIRFWPNIRPKGSAETTFGRTLARSNSRIFIADGQRTELTRPLFHGCN
jgi:hypothetical protein